MINRFLESGVTLVECPDCVCTRTWNHMVGSCGPSSHDRRKTTTPNTGRRWARGKTDWDVVGDERNRGNKKGKEEEETA